MHYKAITSSDELWYKIRNYAESCSWRAGKALANAMDNNVFQEWERVIVAIDNESICGYCTVANPEGPRPSGHERASQTAETTRQPAALSGRGLCWFSKDKASDELRPRKTKARGV